MGSGEIGRKGGHGANGGQRTRTWGAMIGAWPWMYVDIPWDEYLTGLGSRGLDGPARGS